MALTDDIMRLAEKRVALKQQRARIDDELSATDTEYSALVAKLESGHSSTNNGTGDSNTLRDQILAFLSDKETHLDEVQSGVKAPDRQKLLWTLLNLKKSGRAENPRRGYWKKARKKID